MHAEQSIIQRHGGYRKLKSYQMAQLVYDVTVRFCAKYVDRRSRTHDQMVQAARSGVQNIAEGSKASGTSKKTELKLTNVARASLEELRLDFEDYLRHRGLELWATNDPRRTDLVDRRCRTADDVSRWVREVAQGEMSLCAQDSPTANSGRMSLARPGVAKGTPSTAYDGVAANAALVLIGVATALLTRQIAAQADSFENEGGFTERLYRVRQARRH